MNIALIGYGRMGHEIEEIAIKRGHIIKLVIDLNNHNDLNKQNLENIDVVIEFTNPDAALDNIIKCLGFGVPVVSGTTGWLKDYEKAADTCRKNNTSFIHSSNFSLGVNLLFRLNIELSRLMNRYSDYKVSIEEIHHTKKLDAPSGTALTLAEGIIRNNDRYQGWAFPGEQKDDQIPLTSIREGLVPGTHTVAWDSDIDNISIKHEAKKQERSGTWSSCCCRVYP